MELFTVEELKQLEQDDKIYVKYLELPCGKDAGNFEGTCEIIVNNDEFMTADEIGVEFDYTKVRNSDFAVIIDDDKTLQIYKV